MSCHADRLHVDDVEVIRLEDLGRGTRVSIVPSVGNAAYEMIVDDANMLWFPHGSVREFLSFPGMMGNIFLAPWANRLEFDGFWANGKRFALNPLLGNYHYDSFGQPIHGLLRYTAEWSVVDLRAEADGAEVTSLLEFWRYPEFMAQFPFAHTIEMTYRLSGAELEVRTVVRNLSSEEMPLSVGYHPYFTIPGVPRDEWTIRIAARERLMLSDKLVPNGERMSMPLDGAVSLRGRFLDDVFTDIAHDEEFFVAAGNRRIALRYGRGYPVAVVYAPAGRDFICFEPMTGPTNAFNMAHEGGWKLQTVAPGGVWSESFWITVGGAASQKTSAARLEA